MIISSKVIADSVQIDGRRYIRERHIDHLNIECDIIYLGEKDVDPEKSLSARATQLEEQSKTNELTKDPSEVKFDYIQPDELGLKLREQFTVAQGEEAAKLASWFLSRSDDELNSWFKDDTKTLREKMQTIVDAKINLDAKKGE